MLQEFIKLYILKTLCEGRLEDDQDAFNDAVEELMAMPEYQSIEALAQLKYDNDEETYDAVELQALARNIYLAAHPELSKKQLAFAPERTRSLVKQELASYGLQFVPRQAQKNVRGFTAPMHGSNRYAGNHGGSGFTNNYNREPDTKRTWSSDDPTSLRMHAKKR